MAQNPKTNIFAQRITIHGLVQGVGFRPFLYRLANDLGLSGWARNTNHSVDVFIQGSDNQLNEFVSSIRAKKPAASIVTEILINSVDIEPCENFTINQSTDDSSAITLVSPDIAVCDACVYDMHHQQHRLNYALVNCCQCGPRFSIVKALPYDREHTTMKEFKMCSTCNTEYTNVSNRRFHAQPVACNLCGPQYQLVTSGSSYFDMATILATISEKLSNGGVFAMKGSGGFHLVCDATNDQAVKRLRNIKLRDSKPLAVMFKNITTLHEYAHVSDIERVELESFRRPIVILNEKKPLSSWVSLCMGTIGALLPYLPFHYLLFDYCGQNALVFTSGNLSDEPVIIDNNIAITAFAGITDGVLVYNRDIHNRTDDSVVAVVNEKPRLIRRSRGYVPSPVTIQVNCEGIFAAGAELTGTFALGKADKAIVSQYIGDLQNYDNLEFYSEAFNHFTQLFRFTPTLAVADLHPDYASTLFCNKLNINTLHVQHHHAHIASVMAEHQITKPLIGVAFDGTGLGTDQHIWGSEFFVASPTEFDRKFHFEYKPLPGGDKTMLEPWRSAVSYLHSYYGRRFNEIEIPFIRNLEKSKLKLLQSAIEHKINTPLSCSAGRLFDAVAALTGVCSAPTFHAEAPMRLELVIDKSELSSYSYDIADGVISFKRMFIELISDIQAEIHVSKISSKFHNTICKLIVEVCKILRQSTDIQIVALSGGTFQNKYLLGKTENLLQAEGFSVYSNLAVPANDAGIALGQLYIAANRIQNNNQ